MNTVVPESAVVLDQWHYREVEHRISDISVSGGPERGGARARATVSYPAEWSRDADSWQPPPYLSAVVLGLELAEAYLTHAHQLDGLQRRRMWPRRLWVEADRVPRENPLRFDASVERFGVTTTGSVCRNVSRLRSRLGTMKVHCDIEHAGTARGYRAGLYEKADDLLGPAEWQCLGAGHRFRRHAVTEVGVDVPGRRVDAAVLVEPGDVERFDTGMGAEYQPALTVIDGLLVLAQLTRVLLDQTGQSDSLWLRNLELETVSPAQSVSGRHQASVVVRDDRMLSLGGRAWRNADVTGWLGAIKLSGSVARPVNGQASPRANARAERGSCSTRP